MLTVGLVFIVQTLSFMNCSCNFICGLSDVIIKTFSQSVSQSALSNPDTTDPYRIHRSQYDFGCDRVTCVTDKIEGRTHLRAARGSSSNVNRDRIDEVRPETAQEAVQNHVDVDKITDSLSADTENGSSAAYPVRVIDTIALRHGRGVEDGRRQDAGRHPNWHPPGVGTLMIVTHRGRTAKWTTTPPMSDKTQVTSTTDHQTARNVIP